MFSGIIKGKVKILEINSGIFKVKNIFKEKLKRGESISHDGACMTLTEINKDNYSFFVMLESLNKTNFGKKKPGDNFNVETSVKLGDKIDGHIVSGHIDGTGKVKSIKTLLDNSKVIHINFDTKYQNLIIEKGSITVNGVSLTVVDTGKDYFSISIIPLTQEITNLGDINKGDLVNLEFDMMGKYIEKIMNNSKQK